MWGWLRHTERRGIRTGTKFAGSSAGHSESTFCSSVTKVTALMLLQTSHSPLTITVETLCPSITDEKHTVVSRPHILTFSCSPSLPPCCVCSMLEGLMSCYLKELDRQRNPKKLKIESKRGLPSSIKNWNSIFNWNDPSHFNYFSITFQLILVVAMQIIEF